MVTVLLGKARWRPPFELSGRSADQDVRHVVVQVLVGVAHVGPVEDQRVVEQSAVAIGRLLQLVDEVGQALHVILVDVRIVLDVLPDSPRGATRRGSRC